MLSSFETFYFKNLFSIYKKGNIYNAEIILITQGVASDHWITPYLKKVNSLTLKYCRENKKKMNCCSHPIMFTICFGF